MGMDIFGIAPVKVGEMPNINYEESTKEERDQYHAEMNAWEEINPGYYFRANVWSWRPINAIIDVVNLRFELGIDTSNFGDNSGGGVEDPEKCIQLADCMDKYLKSNAQFNTSETMYLNLGLWVADDNTFTITDELEQKLNRQYPVGSILYSSVIANNGQLVKPAWATSVEHVKGFVKFLRNCNGFEIF
jgi:hypothetical protein